MYINKHALTYGFALSLWVYNKRNLSSTKYFAEKMTLDNMIITLINIFQHQDHHNMYNSN